MSNKVKLYNQKNRTYCLFNGTINIKIFDPNSIKIDEKSHKISIFILHGISTNQIFEICKN